MVVSNRIDRCRSGMVPYQSIDGGEDLFDFLGGWAGWLRLPYNNDSMVLFSLWYSPFPKLAP